MLALPLAAGVRGESLLYIVVLDLPVFYFLRYTAPGLLHGAGTSMILFLLLGTLMWAAIGWLLGRVIVAFRNRRQAPR